MREFHCDPVSGKVNDRGNGTLVTSAELFTRRKKRKCEDLVLIYLNSTKRRSRLKVTASYPSTID